MGSILWVRKILWRSKWQTTPVFLPGKSHGQRSLVGYSAWSCRVKHDWMTACNSNIFLTVFHSYGCLLILKVVVTNFHNLEAYNINMFWGQKCKIKEAGGSCFLRRLYTSIAPYFFQLLVALDISAVWLHNSNLYLCLHIAIFSVPLCVNSPNKNTDHWI